MAGMIVTLLRTLVSILAIRRKLALENLALRHQVAVLRSSVKRPRLNRSDRLFWVLLSRTWKDWAGSLAVVKPDTVIRWHRKGFKLYWTWKSRRRGSKRPRVASETRELIRKMSRANPRWGAPKVHGELLKLGIDVSQGGCMQEDHAAGMPFRDSQSADGEIGPPLTSETPQM